MELLVVVIASVLLVASGLPSIHTDNGLRVKRDEHDDDSNENDHDDHDDDEDDHESEDAIIARVKSYIESGTCSPVSCGDHIGNETHSFYTEFQYKGKRVIISNQVPDHKAEQDAPTPNPNVRCEAWQFTQLPLSPTKATTANASSMGTIGFAVTGGAFYNHLSKPNGDLAMFYEKPSLDSCNGHSNPDMVDGPGGRGPPGSGGQGPPGGRGPPGGPPGGQGPTGRPCQDRNSHPNSCTCHDGSTAIFPTKCNGGPPSSCLCKDGSTWTHLQPGTMPGRYHYHATIKCAEAGAATGAGDATKCLHIGYLRDGFPVYGYCQDVHGESIKSCYRMKSSSTEGRTESEYEYDPTDACHLDPSNGGLHPSTGLYSYFMTEDYPYTPIAYSGTLVADVCSAA